MRKISSHREKRNFVRVLMFYSIKLNQKPFGEHETSGAREKGT